MKNFMMEKLRHLMSATSIRALSAPYLPTTLIRAALLLAFTHQALILVGQPAAYWIDRERALSEFGFLQGLLSAGIVPYLLVCLLYLGLLWLVLTILTRSIALVLWLPVGFIHLSQAFSVILQESNLADAAIQDWMAGVNALTTLCLGIILVNGLLRPQQSATEVRGLMTRIRSLAPNAWMAILVLAVLSSALWPRGGWVLLHPEHSPGRRANTAVAYDPVRQRVVLFGGISDWLGSTYQHENDTWEWDGTDWIEMKPETIPVARSGHMMAYDEKRGVVVMFGGEERTGTYMLNDTWEWDGRDWKQIYPDNFPQGRRGGQMFYDHESGRIILLGGFYYQSPNKLFTPLNDIWTWDGITWQYVTTMPKSLIINNPNVAYDTQRGRTVLFDYKQVSSWVGGQWNTIDIGSGPSNRFGTWLAADPVSGRMLLFGGTLNSVQMNDTWMLDGDTWRELHPDLAPRPRDAYVMFFDPSRNSFILYGGVNAGALDDMWELVLP